jgi:hypothetical protein
MDPDEVEGGCYCGEVRYRAGGTPRFAVMCHCADCRRICGAQSVASVTFALSSFSFVKGEPVRFASSPAVMRSFCGHCGTPLSYQTERRPDEIDLTIATLDDPEAFPPTREVFSEQKLSWV